MRSVHDIRNRAVCKLCGKGMRMAGVSTGIMRGRRRDRLTAIALIVVMGSELVSLAFGFGAARYVAYAAMLAVLPLTLHRLGLREGYLLTLCSVLTVLIWRLHDDPAGALTLALDQAVFLMAFIMLVGLMQQAAMTSQAILECGTFLTRQRAGRRYFALFLGTHLMAQLFNLGVVSLLAPLIRRGTEDASDPLNPVRERRQLNSMLRGFAWAVVWSPTAVAPLVLMTLLPDAERGPWMAAGVVIAFAIMLIGWAEDRWQFRRYQPAAGAVSPPFPVRAYADFALVCLALVVLTVGAMSLVGQSVVFGLMVASPIILVGWLIAQNDGAWAPARSRIGEIVLGHLPAAAPLAVTLACSGYVGRAGAALIPAAEWADALGLEAWPGVGFFARPVRRRRAVESVCPQPDYDGSVFRQSDCGGSRVADRCYMGGAGDFLRMGAVDDGLALCDGGSDDRGNHGPYRARAGVGLELAVQSACYGVSGVCLLAVSLGPTARTAA